MNPAETFESMEAARALLRSFGTPYEALLIVVSVVLAGTAVIPGFIRWRGWILASAAAVLVLGELVLIWFHWRLYSLAAVVSPDGIAQGNVAVPLWVESEKLFVWALLLAVLGSLMRRQRKELLPAAMLLTSALVFGAALLGRPFTEPIPGFFGQYYGYLQATAMGGVAAFRAYEGMESARQFYYNAWYMWVHPPMLFLSYAAFALSFVSTLHMIAARHSSFETTAYRWARFGYIWLTLGMLLGFPWALAAWQGESWWWSGKVNMSLMMWLLYTAYLHARLYLRTRGMWKAVAVLGVLSFAVLVLTYITTYVVPGAHSYALLEGPKALAAHVLGGGGRL
jgi:ABC-type transport system involved in cytochrome c biogenesis permease subunit